MWIVLLALPGIAAADTASELRAIEESRRAAIQSQDFSVLEKIYAPTFVAVAGNGQVIDRATLFGVFKRNDPSPKFSTDEILRRNGGWICIAGQSTPLPAD